MKMTRRSLPRRPLPYQIGIVIIGLAIFLAIWALSHGTGVHWHPGQ